MEVWMYEVSLGARRSSWAGRYEVWRYEVWRYGDMEEWCGRGARARVNKGFARRPQEFLAWEV